MSYLCTIDIEFSKIDDLIIAAQAIGADHVEWGGRYENRDVIASFDVEGEHYGVVERNGKLGIVADRHSQSAANADTKRMTSELKRGYAESLLERALAQYGFKKEEGAGENQVVMTRKEGQEVGILQINEDGSMSFGLRGVQQPDCKNITKDVSAALGAIISEKPLTPTGSAGVALPLPIKSEREASLIISTELIKIANIKDTFEQEIWLNNLYKDIYFKYGSGIADKLASGETLKKIAEITLGSDMKKISAFDTLKFKK